MFATYDYRRTMGISGRYHRVSGVDFTHTGKGQVQRSNPTGMRRSRTALQANRPVNYGVVTESNYCRSYALEG
jgi:hypothetical protein